MTKDEIAKIPEGKLFEAKWAAAKRGDWETVTEIQREMSRRAWKAAGLPKGGRLDPGQVRRFNDRMAGIPSATEKESRRQD